MYALGDVSGARVNPAATLAFSVAGRFPARAVVSGRVEHLRLYLTAPTLGALLGVLVAWVLAVPAPVTPETAA